MMTGPAQPYQVLLPTEIRGYIKSSVGIENLLRTHTAKRMDCTIQPTIVQYNQDTRMETAIGTTYPLVVWIVVLVLPDLGIFLITALGKTHRDPS